MDVCRDLANIQYSQKMETSSIFGEMFANYSFPEISETESISNFSSPSFIRLRRARAVEAEELDAGKKAAACPRALLDPFSVWAWVLFAF